MTLDIIRSIEPIPYREAYEKQKDFHARRVAGTIPDTLWLLEHPPVITTGIRRDQSKNILINPASVGTEIVETERGGEITYHGPGQLVGYLFVNIEKHGYQVRRFVEKIEEAFIIYLDDFFGIEARHDNKHTGVWVGKEKITAIGIALRKRVTLHGFAFNVNTDLSHFNWIVPCGISGEGRGITSLKKIIGDNADFNRVAEGIASAVSRALGYDSYHLPEIERKNETEN